MWQSKRYAYPTREAFRFHFEEPTAAPLTHEETIRMRQIMNWDKQQRQTHEDTKPNMSERTGLEYQMAPDVVRKDAPFGTSDTPAITMKIIGGRQIPVIEKHATYNPDYLGSRIQPLRPIADKPNHVDPRTHGDVPGGYYNKDVQDYFREEGNEFNDDYFREEGDEFNDDEHPLEHKGFDYDKYFEEDGESPTTLVNKRPDSKDVVRGQYRALPPIQLNRTRNDMSTVFEAEPWTDNRNPPLADDTEYKQNYFSGQEGDYDMDGYHHQHSGSKDHHYVSETEKNNLFMLVPRNVLLPVDPIRLTRDQEVVLCKLICNDLLRFNPKELRDVYVECSQHDKELRGFCGIEILDNNLRRHKAFLSDTLRIVSAQFVDPNYPGKVNYEKVLSFIGSALQLNQKGQLERGLTREPVQEQRERVVTPRSNEKQPKYYMQNGESYKTGSIYRDREVAKLLRMVEQELSKNTYSMDWTRWQNAFYERDRDHRETLSAAQIKDICYDQKLPLSDSLINQILSLGEDSNRDGQYRWHSFLEFLSRVRPSNTGLPIPVSKRPLEYAKHYPAPVPNWPRTDADTEQRGLSPRRDISPRRMDVPSPRRGQDDRVRSPAKLVRSPSKRGRGATADQENRERYSPDRQRTHDHSPRQGQWHSPVPNGFSSPQSDRYLSPNPAPRNRNRDQRQDDVYNRQYDRDSDERRSYGYKYRNEDDYRNGRHEEENGRYRGRRPDRQADDRRRSYAGGPSGYVPSWQPSPKPSNSPPPNRHGHEAREDVRRDERGEVPDTYENIMKSHLGHGPGREGRSLRRVPSRYQRPMSYAEPPRNREQYSDHQQSRLPAQPGRHRSLSPIRQASPAKGQSYPTTYRENYEEQQYDDQYKEQQFTGRYRSHNFSQNPTKHAHYSAQHQQQPQPYVSQQYEQHATERYNSSPTPKMQQYPSTQQYSNVNQQQYSAQNPYENGETDDYGYGDGYRRDGRDAGYRGGAGRDNGPPSQRPTREQQIHQLSGQLRDLETKYQVTREAMSSNELPWLDRYLKMAQALYNSDITNKGSLPRKDVMDIVGQYNNAFNLNMDMTRANMLAISPENLDKSGNILLRPFLAGLSADRVAYKV